MFQATRMENPTISQGETGAAYVDTPRGIFTAGGIWFGTREADLKEYAGELLEKAPLDFLIRQTELWLRFPQTVSLWLIPLLLFSLGIPETVLIVLSTYLVLESTGALLVNRLFSPFLRFMDHVGVQAGLYIITLSVLGASGFHMGVITGLLGFILFRWGLIEKLFKVLFQWFRQKFYPLPYPDQILKSLMIRYALYHRIDLPQLAEMEGDILRRLNRLRKK